MTITEAETSPVTTPEKKSYLEQQSSNERMRHVPRLERIRRMVDEEIPSTFRKLRSAVDDMPQHDERHAGLDAELKSFCRAIDRITEVVRQRNGHHPPTDLSARIEQALANASATLAGLDADLFGRRYAVQTHERSKAEPIWAAVLVVCDHLRRITALARAIDPNLDERLLEGLVVLQHPLNDETLKAIA
jgi:hypothetical protein